jgi:hypothetical protein
MTGDRLDRFNARKCLGHDRAHCVITTQRIAIADDDRLAGDRHHSAAFMPLAPHLGRLMPFH